MRWDILATIGLSVATAMLAINLDSAPAGAAEVEPVRLIFDTDICGDCDDAGAGHDQPLSRAGLGRGRHDQRRPRAGGPVRSTRSTPSTAAASSIGVVGQGGVVGRSRSSAGRGAGRRRRGSATRTTCPRASGPGRGGRALADAGGPGRQLGGRSPRSASRRTWPGCSTRRPDEHSPMTGPGAGEA